MARGSDEHDELQDDTNDVWADQPSKGYRPNSPAAEPPSSSSATKITEQFDDFDPFRPTSSTPPPPPPPVDSSPDVTRKPVLTGQSAVIPSSPDKTSGPPVPEKSVASVKESTTNATSTPSQSTTTSILGNIAAAFKKREQYASPSTSPSISRVATPSASKRNSAAPSAPPLLVPMREPKDALFSKIDDSEKSAMPAMPASSGVSDSAQHDGNDTNDTRSEDNADAHPFDFNLFLEQMRARQAEPIAKYLRSFLKEFSKRTWNVNEQIRVINDYLDFIAVKMRENEVWKDASDREFDNAVEAMEKLVMNRVYHLTFIPALTPTAQASTQTDDLERDHVLSQRIRLFGWINESHLDLPKLDDSDSFLDFARQELLKVNNYKAPRDKLICILNCCKVIFGLMRHLGTEDGADTFIPFLILVVLRSNPPHLISNVQYIQRFRNPDRLAGENGYYLSSLNGAISFVETLAGSSLSNITEEEFATNVERAIAALPAETAGRSSEEFADHGRSERGQHSASSSRAATPHGPATEDEASSPSLLSAPRFGPVRSVSPAEATRDFFARSTDNLSKTVSKPLQALGKIFNEMGSETDLIAGVPAHGAPHTAQSGGQQPGHGAPYPGLVRAPVRQRSGGSTRSVTSPRGRRGYSTSQDQQTVTVPPSGTPSRPGFNEADYVDDSMSPEQVQAQAERNHQTSSNAKIDTLVSIFPGIDRETLEIVLLSHGEDVEAAIESLLEMG